MQPNGSWVFGLPVDPGDVNISANATEGTTVYDFAGQANIPEGIVRVHASSSGYNTATLDIPVISRDATDVTGYRVLLTAPGANAWKGIAKKAVTVEVVRADRIAYPWTEFSSIAVSLRDTLLQEVAIYTLTASGFNTATGDLTFSRARAENTVSPDPAFGKNADANEITYNAGSDKLIFKFQTKAALGGGGAALGDIDDAHDREPEDADGQRTAVYAVVTFNVGGTAVGTLNNKEPGKDYQYL